MLAKANRNFSNSNKNLKQPSRVDGQAGWVAWLWLGWIHFVSQVNSLQVLNDSLFCRSLHSSEHSNYREGWQVKPNGSKSQKFSGQLECKLLHKMCQTLPTQNTCQTASEQIQKLQSKSVTAKRKQDREKPKKKTEKLPKKKHQESHEKFRGKLSRWATGFNGARTGLGATSFASASASFGPRSGDKTRCPAKWILPGN